MSDDTDTQTLYDRICEVTGLSREEAETAEAFKGRLVQHFADEYPNTDEGNAAFDALDDDVADWVNKATELAQKNRSARKPKRLPELDGLAEDEGGEKKKGRAASGSGSPKRERTAGSTGGAKRELAETFAPAPEGALVSKFLTTAFRQHGFSKQKEMSDEGHIVYKHTDGREVHVGPGKSEKVYMMGWRAPGQPKHSYGGDSLREYLAKAS